MFHGKVSQVRKSPTTTQNVVTYQTIIAVEQPGAEAVPGHDRGCLHPGAERDKRAEGAECRAALLAAGQRQVSAPPPKKLERAQQLAYVLQADNHDAGAQIVHTGATDGVSTEILDGLKQGKRRHGDAHHRHCLAGSGTNNSDPPSVDRPEPSCQPRAQSPQTRSAVAGEHIIALRDITKVYVTGEVEVRAVAGVSLDIRRGEFVAIMGASGSGKSTMMNILGCLDRPTAGRYLLDESDVAGLNRKELAQLRNRKTRLRIPELQSAGAHHRAWKMSSCRCSTANRR